MLCFRVPAAYFCPNQAKAKDVRSAWTHLVKTETEQKSTSKMQAKGKKKAD